MIPKSSRLRVVAVVLVALALFGGFGACAATPKNQFGAGGGASTGATGATGTSSGLASGPSTSTGVIPPNDGGTGGGPSNCTICSADLKSVTDCYGHVLKQCKSDEGCANSMCIQDPCTAATLAQSSYGCDYWALKTDIYALGGGGACFAAYVANTWSTPVHLTVERSGVPIPIGSWVVIPVGQGQALKYSPYDPVAGLPPGEVAILLLSQGPVTIFSPFMPRCPNPAAVQMEAGVTGTGIGAAFHIKTDYPVVAYQIQPFGGGAAAATSATLLLPTSVWDTNYIAINAFAASQLAPGADPSLDLLAMENGTTVTMLPKNPIVAGTGVMAAPANKPVTFSLNAGEYIQITQTDELSGSPIQSNKPIGVWGGESCMNIPVGTAACDSAMQQLPPIRAMGTEYAAVRYRGRAGGKDETPPWRIVGAVNGTALTWTPSIPAGAPTTLELGTVLEFPSAGPFIVASQDKDHPFYLGAHMTGGSDFGGEGDPEWVNVVPTAQYLDSYVLFTDPTYSETELVIVRKRGPNKQFADVKLDCAGVLTGWQPVGSYEWLRADLVTGNFQNVGNCSNGRHELSSAAPFAVTVWGWGTIAGVAGQAGLYTQYVSYAYPAGMSVQPINQVVIPPIPK